MFDTQQQKYESYLQSTKHWLIFFHYINKTVKDRSVLHSEQFKSLTFEAALLSLVSPLHH